MWAICLFGKILASVLRPVEATTIRQTRSNSAWLSLLIPTLLVLVAATQIYRANVQDLTPWKGGGFGMFASVDSRGSRILRAYALIDGREVPFSIPRAMDDRASKFRAEPNLATLRWLAKDLAAMKWYDREVVRTREKRERLESLGIVSDTKSASPTESEKSVERKQRLRTVGPRDPEPPIDSLVSVDAIHLELWRREFDSKTARVSRRLEYDVTVEPPELSEGESP